MFGKTGKIRKWTCGESKQNITNKTHYEEIGISTYTEKV